MAGIEITDRRCGKCWHWRTVPMDVSNGLCARYPPVPYPMMTPNNEQITLTVWPRTHATQVCGEFQSPTVVEAV